MVSNKRKRKLQYEDKTYYWWIRKNDAGYPQIHIISEDRNVYLEKSFDKEIGIGTGYIERILRTYEEEKEQK